MFNFLVETFRLGLKNLRLHKLRSILTALGIIIGVGAFIVTVAIGEGAKQAALDVVRQLGAHNIVISSVTPPASNDASQRTQRILEYGLKRDDVMRIKTLPGIAMIVPMRDPEQKVVRGDIRASANAIGTTPQLFEVLRLPLEPGRGRYFTDLENDEDNPAAVCVMGALAARQLFPYEDPLGAQIQVGSTGGAVTVLTVVGVLERSGLRAGGTIIKRDIDQDIYFPLRLAQQIFHDTYVKQMPGSFERKTIQLTEVWVQAKEIDQVERLSKIIENTIAATHGSSIDYDVKAPIELLRTAERTNRTWNFVIGGISGFSLVVGGIGIMNIMLASVTERTREIGIRRALGAKRRHITLQFLIETTVISLSGGFVGIILGAGGAVALPVVVHYFSSQTYPTVIATWSVLGSFIFSGIVGIFFGLYPAMTAARMDPIEALRHE